MPSFSRHDIDNMGFRAAREFAQGATLHSSIVKIARDNSMNPEQIKRLVESANTTAFLNAFKEKTGNQRMVEFDVADPKKVIDEAIAGSDPVNPSSGSPTVSITITVDKEGAGLHDTIHNENQVTAPDSHDKVASYEELPVVKLAQDTSTEIKLSPYAMHQAKESLLTKLADCNYQASDLADSIARSYVGIYNKDKYASLELDALSTYGNSALPALQMVRSRLDMDKIASTLSPQQEYFLSDRHIVESSTELNKVASIIALCTEHKKLVNSIDYIHTVLGA